MNFSTENFALMDKKHIQHSKSTKKKRSKSKRKHDETEVFVIPPDLLQKLGINLGNVQITQVCPITEVPSDTTGFKTQLNTAVNNITSSNDLKTPVDYEKETSILETANLMTKSVFLSPTFTPVCANIIPGELEISNAIRTENKSIDAMHKSNPELNTNILKEQDTLIPNVEPIKKNADSDQLPQDILENQAEELSLAKNEYNSENDLVATPLQENHIGFSNDVSRNINMDVIEKTDRKMSTDDHLDEAYSSDCSNSNLGPIENSDSLNYIPEDFIKSPTQITSKNKINIISEEILSPSQLNELKSLHSPIVSDLIPVTIHTVISWNKNNDKFDDNVLTTDSLFHKQNSARNALEVNNIEGRNHSEDNIKLSSGLPVEIQAPNICHENKYIDESNLIKEVQEISCTIHKNMSQMSNEEVLNDNTQLELDNSDNNLGVCIDFEVMDLDKHLEENVEILEEFVNGITSNDSDEILEKLEQNEKICFNETKLPEMAVDGITITDNISSKRDEIIKEETHSKNESNSNITCVPLDVLSNIDEEMHIDSYDNIPNIVDEYKIEGDVNINAKERPINTFEVKQLKEDLTGLKNDEEISLLQKSTKHDGELIKNNEQLNNEFSLKQHNDFDLSNSKNSSDDSVTQVCDEKTIDNDALKNRISDANVPIEKIEEIAMYLGQCLSSRRLKSRAMFPKRKEIMKQTKQNCLKSKLCIQGVEKPGGSKENVKNAKEVILKTYGRVNRSKKKNVPEPNETKLNDAVLQNKSEDLKLQPNSITLSYDCTSKEFCLCHDFGSLTFYDCNSEYEHIHFWEHDNIDCDRDVIFSMYVEDYSVDLYHSNDTDMITEINENNPKVIGRSICWNNIRDDFICETCREVPNNADAGTADCLKNESIHYSQNLTGTINNENVKNEVHPHENRSGYIPKIIIEINYGESEFDGHGFQTAEPNKTIHIDNNEMENVDKTDVDDKIIQETPLTERQRSSETILNTIDQEPSKIIETRNNPIIEETLDVHSDSSKESSFVIGSRSNSNKNEKKNKPKTSESKEINDGMKLDAEITAIDAEKSKQNSIDLESMTSKPVNKVEKKRKRSSKIIEEHGLDVGDNEPYSKKSIKCGVCEKFLSENEWEDHIRNEHCYIAWRQGRTRDSIDLNDSVLSKKLDQILTNNGDLKCSFCEVIKKNVDKFLSHVRKCLKLKDSPDTSVSSTSRNAEAVSEKLNLTSSNPEIISEELESIPIHAKHGRNTHKSTSTNIKAKEHKEMRSTNPEDTGESESTSPALIEAELMTVDSHGKCQKRKSISTNLESFTESPKSTSSMSKPISEKLISPSIDSEAKNKKQSQSTSKTQISQEQDPKSVSLSPELKRENLISTTTSTKTISDKPKSLDAKASTISKTISEQLKSPPDDSKTKINKKRQSQSNTKNQITREQDPKSAPLNAELKRETPKSTSNASDTTSDKPKLLDAKAGSKNRKSKSSNSEPFDESSKFTPRISEPIREELKSPQVDSKDANKKRKLQSTPKTQISQEQDPKSASLSPELKRDKHRSTSTESETTCDKPKSIQSKDGSKNRKSFNSKPFAESSKSTSGMSEPIGEELKSPLVDSKDTIKKRKLQSTSRTQISQEQDSKSASLSPEHKRVKPKSTSDLSETVSDKPKSIEAKAGSKNSKSKSSNSEPFAESSKATSSIFELLREELKSPPVDSKDTNKKRKLQSTPKTQISQERDPKSASTSDASETISDKYKSIETKAGSKNSKSKSSNSESFAKSHKSTSSISEPIHEELKSPPFDSKPTIKKSKLQSTPKTQISQERDPKSASLSSELKKEKLKATSTALEAISDKPKSLDAKSNIQHRKSTLINTESTSEEPESTSTTSKHIDKEPIATSIDSKEKESKTINLKASGKRKSISTEPIIENIERNSDAISQESQPLQSMTKCGVCQQEVEDECWIDHIAGHDYLAWEDGSTPLDLDNEEEVRRHLNDLAKQIGGLKCSKCGLTRKYLKSYLQHIVKCNATEISPQVNSSDSETKLKVKFEKTVPTKCGVCQKDLTDATWMEHIATEHNYLAWRDGETPLDLDDEEVARQHLHTIAKQIGELICSKCGLVRRYAKSFLHHIKHCEETVESDVPEASETNDSQMKLEGNTTLQTSGDEENEDVKLLVTCGVCKKEISSVRWILHIQTAHNYLAWKEGESLDINNAEEVQNHLYAISKFADGLTCSKCGMIRKYVKAYQHHFANCDVIPPTYDESNEQTNKEPSCGVCSEKVAVKDWINHKMEKHYNIAWTSAQIPIDIKNTYAVERLLKEYKEIKKKLVCKVCGCSRASCMGFYAHILTCGKSEEETEMFQNTCEICNKQYLCIYQNQHMAFHREQGYARERKLKEAEQKAVKVEETIDSTSGRRKAAEKARTVIENYKTSSQFSHNCPDCGFGTDSRKEIDNHVCKKERDLDDSDASVHSASDSEGSDDDAEESGVDSNVSEEEPQNIKKRIREYVPLPVKVPRLPFSVNNPSNYLLMCGAQLCKANSTTDSLFVDWNRCEYEPVADDQLVNYVPPLEQSCKVKFAEESWTTYSRFEAKKGNGYSIFVGACIQCISWAPGLDDSCGKFLAVTCHSGADLPRYEPDVTVLHSGLIQIWNFGNMRSLPEMALGIAHDYGTVWSMDWCPYGARDFLPVEHADVTSRLGLLAVSCSSGQAYVFSVPYPSTIPLKNDKLIYKLKPVAELRLTTGSERPFYQATSVRWCQQKDQAFVVVGYGDGTTAYFDLNSESPLLKTKRNGITIFYPYHDERPNNSCVLGLSVYPSGSASVPAGAVCSASPTGAEAVMRPGLRPARLHSRIPSSVVMFQPHWPAALLAGDDAIISTSANELEWWGGGRRLGAVSACAGCAHCARIATFQPPLLRLIRLHPAYSETKKQTIGSLQMMPIGKKRKVVTDELTTKLEPITYEEAIRKYGIELKMDKSIQAPQTNKPRDQFPERFPLGDVRSLAFCPSFKHHGKLAVATHAGIIFLITV